MCYHIFKITMYQEWYGRIYALPWLLLRGNDYTVMELSIGCESMLGTIRCQGIVYMYTGFRRNHYKVH
jgi:hypothetical protein